MVKPSGKTTYTLVAIGNDGQARTQQVSVTVIVPQPQLPSARPSSDDRALLIQLIRDFESAYNSQDIARVKSVWSGMTPGQSRQIQAFFKGNPEATVKDDCVTSSLSVTGDTAQWSCAETTTVKSNNGKPQKPHPIKFSFIKKNDSWSISERQ